MTQEIENDDDIIDELDAAERAYEAEDGNEDEQSTEQPKQSGAAYADDASGMSPAVAEGKMKELIATPGYVTGQLKFDNPAAYSRILREVAALAQIAARGDAEKARSAFAAMVEAQGKKSTEALADYQWLTEHGFEGLDGGPPDDVPPHLGQAWKMQRLVGEGDFDAWTPMVEAELSKHKVDSDYQAAFKSFSRVINKMDAELRDDIVERITRYIYRANEQKRSRK